MITGVEMVLFMYHVANQTILYTKHLLMQASKPVIPSQMTWMAINKKDLAGKTWQSTKEYGGIQQMHTLDLH